MWLLRAPLLIGHYAGINCLGLSENRVPQNMMFQNLILSISIIIGGWISTIYRYQTHVVHCLYYWYYPLYKVTRTISILLIWRHFCLGTRCLHPEIPFFSIGGAADFVSIAEEWIIWRLFFGAVGTQEISQSLLYSVVVYIWGVEKFASYPCDEMEIGEEREAFGDWLWCRFRSLGTTTQLCRELQGRIWWLHGDCMVLFNKIPSNYWHFGHFGHGQFPRNDLLNIPDPLSHHKWRGVGKNLCQQYPTVIKHWEWQPIFYRLFSIKNTKIKG